MCLHRNIQPRGPGRQRAIPSISKSREEEIRKILRGHLQKTRQRVGNSLSMLVDVMSPAWIKSFNDEHLNKCVIRGFAPACPQLRSYSRHDLLIDPFEDNVSEIRFRKQRVEMERRVSLTVILFVMCLLRFSAHKHTHGQIQHHQQHTVATRTKRQSLHFWN